MWCNTNNTMPVHSGNLSPCSMHLTWWALLKCPLRMIWRCAFQGSKSSSLSIQILQLLNWVPKLYQDAFHFKTQVHIHEPSSNSLELCIEKRHMANCKVEGGIAGSCSHANINICMHIMNLHEHPLIHRPIRAHAFRNIEGGEETEG